MEEEPGVFDEALTHVADLGGAEGDEEKESEDPLALVEKWRVYPGISDGARKVLMAAPKLTPRRAEVLSVKQAEVEKQVVQFNMEREDEEEMDPNPERADGTLKPPRPFVDLPPFNIFIACTILLNACVLGLDVDMAAGNDGVLSQGLVDALQYLCLFVFVVELGLRIAYGGQKFFTSRTRRLWNWMDVLIVGVAMVGSFAPIDDLEGDKLRLIMTLQVLKIIRLLRLIRFVPILHELWLVSNGLLNALTVLTWICAILFIFIYMFAIVCTLTIGQNDELYDPYYQESGGWDHEIYFGNTARSMFTLVQVLTLDDWADGVVRHVLSQQPWMAAIFIVFILIVAMGFMAITVGVIVENTLHTTAEDEEYLNSIKEKDRQAVYGQLREIFEDADTDGSGSLDLGEVEKATSKPEVYNKLKMIDFPVEDPQEVFDLLAFQRPQELTIEEFISGCMRMKGQAKSRDLLVAQVSLDGMKRHYEAFEFQSKQFRKRLTDLDRNIRSLIFQGELVFLNPQEYRLRHKEWKGSEAPKATEADLRQAPWVTGTVAAGQGLRERGAGGDHEKPASFVMHKQVPEHTRVTLQTIDRPHEEGFARAGNPAQPTEVTVNLPGSIH